MKYFKKNSEFCLAATRSKRGNIEERVGRGHGERKSKFSCDFYGEMLYSFERVRNSSSLPEPHVLNYHLRKFYLPFH